MDLTIYEPLSQSINTDGLGTLVQFVDDPKVTETEGSDCILEFSYLMDGQCANYLKRDYVIASKINNRQAIQPFVIIEVEPDYIDRIIYVTARHKTFSDLSDRVVPELKIPNMSVQNALNRVAQHIQTPAPNIRMVGNGTQTFSAEYKETTANALLFSDKNSLLRASHSELLLMDGGFTFTPQRGRKNALQISKGDSLIKKLAVTHDREDMVTRIIPFTTLMKDYVQVKTEERKSYSRATKEEKVYGKPVISAMVDNGYPVITRYVEYRNERLDKENNYKVKVDGNEKEIELSHYRYEKIEQLDNEASSYFSDNAGIDQEKVTAKLDVIPNGAKTDELRELNVYDTVFIYDEKYNDDIELMVTKTVYNPITETIESVAFSSERVSQSQANATINSGRPSSGALSNQSQAINNSYNANTHLNFLMNSDGTLMGRVTELPPSENSKEGDMMFLDSGDKVEIYHFENGEWVRLIGTNDTDNIKDYIESEILPFWQAYDEKMQAWDEETDKKLEAFNQSVEDRLNGTYESTIAYLDQYNDEITQQVRDEMEQTQKELELSIGKLVTPDEMNDQIDHMIAQAKADMISSDELHASINEAIANAKSDLLTPLQVHDMIEQALAEQGIDEAEIERLLKEYDGFVRVEDYQQWAKEKQKEIDEAWRNAIQGKELSQTTIELLGKPEHIDYGKNLVDGATTQSDRNGRFTIKSKHPLEKDKKYTLSFKLECLLPQKGSLVLNFKDSDSHVMAGNSALPTADATIVINHQANEPQQANFELNFKDDDSNVQQNDAQLPTADATVVIKH